jgi:hypothetical protein
VSIGVDQGDSNAGELLAPPELLERLGILRDRRPRLVFVDKHVEVQTAFRNRREDLAADTE